MDKKRIMVLGDSLSFGYLPLGEGQMNPTLNWPKKLVDLLTNYYRNKYEFEIIINAQPGRTITKPLIDFGFSQDNATDKFKEMLANNNSFDVLIIFLGTNDYFGYQALHQNNYDMKPKKICEIVVNNLSNLLKAIALEAKEKYNFVYQPLVIIPPKALLQNGNDLLTEFPQTYEQYFQKQEILTVNLQINANPQREDLIKYDGIHYTPEDTTNVAQSIFNVLINNKFFK